MSPKIKIIFIELVVIVIIACILEISGRFYFKLKHGYSFEESFLYEQDADIGYRINKHYKGEQGKYYQGFRNSYFEIDKNDKFRIVCVGGSLTFGHAQMDNSKTWPNILEHILNEKLNKNGRNKIEVINAAVVGYGSSNILARLKKDIVQLSPDVLLIMEGGIFLGCPSSKHSWVPENVVYKKQPLFQNINNYLVGHSILYIQIKKIAQKFGIVKIAQPIDFNIEIWDEKSLDLYRSDFLDIIEISRTNNILPVIIISPEFESKIYLQTAKIQKEIAGLKNVSVIDCSKIFNDSKNDKHKEYLFDEVHFTDEGNKKIAEVVASVLVKTRIIK